MGEVDEDNRADGDDVIFLYPDLVSCISGTFSHGRLTKGHYGHVTGEWSLIGQYNLMLLSHWSAEYYVLLVGIRREFGILVPEVTLIPEFEGQTLR